MYYVVHLRAVSQIYTTIPELPPRLMAGCNELASIEEGMLTCIRISPPHPVYLSLSL